MRFCSHCGSTVELRVPEGDSLPRFICPACKTVHYQNPRVVMGSIPQWKDQVLLCKRAIEPRLGYWTLPAGFLENGETIAEAAIRETREEACAEIELLDLFSIINVAHVHQLHMFYLARMREPVFSPGVESLETALYAEHEIPWDDLAFPTVYKTLKAYYADRLEGRFRQHLLDITWPMKKSKPPAEDG